MARQLWWCLLWVMRRPAIKRIRTRSWQMWASPHRERMRDRIFGQDRFARRYGLLFLRITFSVVLGFLMVGLALWVALKVVDSGIAEAPDYLRTKN